MAILNNSNAISSGGYDINNSLRLRSSASAYLNRTPASAGNQKTFTWSGWVKRGTLGSAGCLFGGGTSAAAYSEIYFAGDNFAFYNNLNSTANVNTTAVFRDPSAWYHLVVAVDTTQATAANRVKLYVNGTQLTAFGTATYPTQNTNMYINSSAVHSIGTLNYTAGFTDYFDGYMTDINFIDGQALTPSSFGETDTTTGSWKPKAYTGTYGTNGFYLKFSDIATTSGSNAGLGKDFSGNTNYWTTNNISVTAGTTYDAMIDSPTLTSATVANYCVMNPLKTTGTGVTSSNGNLDVAIVASASLYGSTFGTIGVSSGKWYWEVTQNSFSGSFTNSLVCIAQDTVTDDYVGLSANGYGYANSGLKWNSGSSSAYGATFTTNDIIGVALDMDAGTITFYKNNTSQGTAFTGLSGTFFPALSNGNSSSTKNYTTNFGQRPFTYTPPTGFVRLNTYNLPDSTIKKGNTVMDATLYTGTGSAQSITNAASFKPDLVWQKSRSNAYSHGLNDSNRGAGKFLYPNLTDAEGNYPTDFSSFNSNGFSLGTGTGPITNASGGTYVAWQWQAGQGSTSSNTSGTITSNVSVNTTAGFSVVTYTGTGSNATVGHGLGVAPSMVIVKQRNTTGAWLVGHANMTNWTYYLLLNQTVAQAVNTAVWNSTAPTSTVFSLGTDTNVNTNTGTYVAYCWAEIAGFSKFTSYVGNGSTDGPFVFLGFRPKFILIKNTTTAGYSWQILDTARNTYNVMNAQLFPNSSAAEDTTNVLVDYLSNGFKLRNGDGAQNLNSNTYIVAAWAENPFKNSNAR